MKSILLNMGPFNCFIPGKGFICLLLILCIASHITIELSWKTTSCPENPYNLILWMAEMEFSYRALLLPFEIVELGVQPHVKEAVIADTNTQTQGLSTKGQPLRSVHHPAWCQQIMLQNKELGSWSEWLPMRRLCWHNNHWLSYWWMDQELSASLHNCNLIIFRPFTYKQILIFSSLSRSSELLYEI